MQDEVFEAIARAYGITAAELSGPPSDAARARALHRLLNAARGMDDHRLSRLADLADDLAGPSGK